MFRTMSIKVLFFFSLLEFLDAQMDLTRVPNAFGTEVVFATVSQIQQSRVFTDDNRFLRRVAYAESRDGTDADTFREDYNGGIWQVDEEVFRKTLDVDNHPELTVSGGIYEGIGRSFRIDWEAVQWEQLRIPIISALAARIFFALADTDIPDVGNVRDQGEFWKSTGFNSNDSDTVEFFVTTINTLELEECPNRGIDLAFVLDSSGSVGRKNFELEKQLVSDIVDRFSIGPNATQVAVISYSGFAVINFHLNDFPTRAAVQGATSQVEYFDIPVIRGYRNSTNTADALIKLRSEVLVTEGGARDLDKAIPRVAVVITDGRSNINASLTIPSALALRDEGVTVYSVGVGNRINFEELNAMASSPDNVRQLRGFDVTEFDGLRSRITADACTAVTSIELAQLINIQLEMGQMSYFEFQLPVDGLTISLMRQQGSVSLFASDKLRNPNSAFYDYRIDDEGEVFVDYELLAKRQRRDVSEVTISNSTLFVSVEGIANISNFQIVASLGNTIMSSASSPHSHTLSFIHYLGLIAILYQRH